MSQTIVNQNDIKKLQSMADWMDSRFTIPGTSIHFGLDSLFGLIPGIGDTVTLASTVYLIGVARTYELPWYYIVKMIGNAAIDWFIGLVPLFGDIFDIGWKSNQRNVAIIRAYLENNI